MGRAVAAQAEPTRCHRGSSYSSQSRCCTSTGRTGARAAGTSPITGSEPSKMRGQTQQRRSLVLLGARQFGQITIMAFHAW
jgi:hypothetical protein